MLIYAWTWRHYGMLAGYDDVTPVGFSSWVARRYNGWAANIRPRRHDAKTQFIII